MASGISIDDKPDHLIEGLLSVRLDNQLIEYHKLMATLATQLQDADKANKHAKELLNLILMVEDKEPSIEDNTKKLLKEMDNWTVRIDPKSLPLPQDKLILKPEFRNKKGNRKK